MNTRIEKDCFFQAAIHFRGSFYVNTYEVTFSMLVQTDFPREQSVAMERLNYFMSSILQHTLLIKYSETDQIKKYKKAGIKILELPDEPLDQLIAMILIQKLNAIMENRIIITDINLGSVLSEGIRYNIVSEIAEDVLSGDHWWNKSSLHVCDEKTTTKKGDNVVKLFDDNKWTDLGLSWKEKASK
jgi:hypothetical protein